MFEMFCPDIDSQKSTEFEAFLRDNACDRAFWSRNKENACGPVDKAEIDQLFVPQKCSQKNFKKVKNTP